MLDGSTYPIGWSCNIFFSCQLKRQHAGKKPCHMMSTWCISKEPFMTVFLCQVISKKMGSYVGVIFDTRFTRWVHRPSNLETSIAETETRGGWMRGANATSVLCYAPNQWVSKTTKVAGIPGGWCSTASGPGGSKNPWTCGWSCPRKKVTKVSYRIQWGKIGSCKWL